jgi:transcriptional regulator with XRE-family HTH domain
MRRVDVHQRLRVEREGRGWTAAQLARRMGHSVLTVYRLEHPRWNRRVPMTTIVRACDALGVHPADVFGWQPPRLATLLPPEHIAGG